MNLYDVLRQLGYKVFLDQVGLKAGDAIRSRLQEGLRASQSGVLIWSNAITDSEWLEQESSTLAAYYELLRISEGKSVALEEYAREMILLEEMHLDEVNKMLRKPGEIEPFSE